MSDAPPKVKQSHRIQWHIIAAALHSLFVKIWLLEDLHQDFKDATDVSIYKNKGDM